MDLHPQTLSQEVIVLSTVPHSAVTLPASSAAEPHCSEHTISAARFILQWLEQMLRDGRVTTPTSQVSSHQQACSSTDACIAEKFWVLSPHLLATVSVQSVNFFRVYFELLASKVNQLQAEITREFETSEGTNTHTYTDKLEKEVLPHFEALLTVDPKVRDITVALVTSQIEETATKLALTSNTTLTGVSTAVRYPVNLWRKVLGQ